MANIEYIKVNIPIPKGESVNTELLQKQIEAVQPEGVKIGVGVISDSSGNPLSVSLDIPSSLSKESFEEATRAHLATRPKSDKETFEERPKPADLNSRVSSLESQLQIIKAHLGLK